MLLEQVIQDLNSLRCSNMAQAIKEYASSPETQELSHVEFVGLLVNAEKSGREDKRLKRLIKEAGFKINACFEGIDLKASRGLDRQAMMNLRTCDWITKAQNLIITGATGTGKSHIGCAFGNVAVRKGIPTHYYRQSRLLEELEMAYADGSARKFRRKLERSPLLMIDDFGLVPMTERGRQQLFEVIDDRVGTGSTIIASQLPISEYYSYLGEATIAEAILDRLVHSAHRLELKGESRRKLNNHITLPNESTFNLDSDKAVSA